MISPAERPNPHNLLASKISNFYPVKVLAITIFSLNSYIPSHDDLPSIYRLHALSASSIQVNQRKVLAVAAAKLI